MNGRKIKADHVRRNSDKILIKTRANLVASNKEDFRYNLKSR